MRSDCHRQLCSGAQFRGPALALWCFPSVVAQRALFVKRKGRDPLGKPGEPLVSRLVSGKLSGHRVRGKKEKSQRVGPGVRLFVDERKR